MNLVGQIAAFSLLALSLDLIWGFCGILSLGHGLYFAIGGYLVAMHLVKVAFEATGTPPDFMLFMGWDAHKALIVFFLYAFRRSPGSAQPGERLHRLRSGD